MKHRMTYHHGDLKDALIQAADEIIAEGGIEAFSLRAAAQRAGVSPAAPAHHFGSTKGLLTEVALLAFERVDRYIQDVGHSEDVVTDVRALSLAFIHFVLEHPGHFRLMFRNDLVNRDDPRFARSAPGQACDLDARSLLTRVGARSTPRALMMPPICCAAWPPCTDWRTSFWRRRRRISFEEQSPVSSSKTTCRESLSAYTRNTGSRQPRYREASMRGDYSRAV